MKPKRANGLLTGVVLPALYELLLDGSGIGIKERWKKLQMNAEEM